MGVKKKQAGFTLIEILIVVAIIASLLLIFAPNGFLTFGGSQVQELRSNGKTLANGLTQYYIENKSYPASAPIVANAIDSNTKVTIRSMLSERGVFDPYTAYADIVAAGGFKRIDDLKIKDMIAIDSSKLANYFFVDNIAETSEYKNQLAGYVFSYISKKATNGTLYSGEFNRTLNTGLQPCATGGYTCIMTPEELNDVRNHLNDATKKYRLGADIDLAGYDPGDGLGWMPIGSIVPLIGFTGLLDGNGFVIANLTINRPAMRDVGLFGYLSSLAATNIKLFNVNVNGSFAVGALAGTSDSAISSAAVTGKVNGTANLIGGLVGNQSGGSITSSLARVDVASPTDGAVGGLAGGTVSTLITQSYASGKITGTYYTGGLIGKMQNGSTISRSYASGSVVSGNSLGGLVGATVSPRNTISDSYATGSVAGTNQLGGLVGYLSDNSIQITNSFSTGLVSGGGLDIGGNLGGDGIGPILTNVFYDGDRAKQSDTGKGVKKTTTEMVTPATYTGFDSTTIWKIAYGTYPVLRNMP
jgi:prepilin-type N-terminal cleavage/methylation domain-containing protein